jgi:preprotein translocase subunit SecA
MSDVAALPRIANGLYPERRDKQQQTLERIGTALMGTFKWPSPGTVSFRRVLRVIEDYGRRYRAMDEAQLDAAIEELRYQLRGRGLRTALVGRSFALIREISGRTLGIRHHQCQLKGGWILLQGMIAEMQTGEGKTLTATLAAGTAALAGVPTHVVSVNDYLTRRDAETLSPVYRRLGLSVGTVVAGMDPAARRRAYDCDVTYCTNKELVFDYLKDRITLGNRTGELRLAVERLYGGDARARRLLLRGLRYAIVDEADSVLIDEARTPLIISGPAQGNDEVHMIRQALELSKELRQNLHYLLESAERRITLTDEGKAHLRQTALALGGLWKATIRREELITQALTARLLFHRDEHYLVEDGKVVIIDEYTGRSMPDRSWNRGLHQLIEAKEGCELTVQRDPLARISYQRFFRRYLHLSGMTGTAGEVRRELWSVYKLRMVRVPTHRPVARRIFPDRIYGDMETKWRALTDEVARLARDGRPVLIGTRTLAASEQLSERLHRAGLAHSVLNARQNAEEAAVIARAGERGRITIATNMAGRGTDIHLGDGIEALGGLHVVLTERHDARRIDRQLIGRCARQGDRGSCVAMLSWDDGLMDVLRTSWLAGLARQRGLLHTGTGQWLSRLMLRRAQRKVEGAHFKMRKELLKVDEQLGDLLSFSGYLE